MAIGQVLSPNGKKYVPNRVTDFVVEKIVPI